MAECSGVSGGTHVRLLRCAPPRRLLKTVLLLGFPLLSPAFCLSVLEACDTRGGGESHVV